MYAKFVEKFNLNLEPISSQKRFSPAVPTATGKTSIDFTDSFLRVLVQLIYKDLAMFLKVVVYVPKFAVLDYHDQLACKYRHDFMFNTP